MAKLRCVFIFDTVKAGWSETYFIEKSLVNQALEPCRAVAAKRAAMLGKFATIEAVRVSTVEPPRISVLEIFRIPGSAYNTTLSDTPWQAILVRFSDQTEQFQTSRSLRGVPDAWISRDTENGKYDLFADGVVRAAVAGFNTALANNGFLFRDRDTSGVTNQPGTPTAWGRDADGRITFTGGPITTVGQKVTFFGFQGDARDWLLGSHTVKAWAGGVTTLNTKVDPDVDLGAWTGTKAWNKNTGYFPFYYHQTLRPISRDTGRPFFLRRGRQPASKIPLSTPAGG